MPINKQAWPGTHQFKRVQCDGGRQEAGGRTGERRAMEEEEEEDVT